jgi:hypothetical protein
MTRILYSCKGRKEKKLRIFKKILLPATRRVRPAYGGGFQFLLCPCHSDRRPKAGAEESGREGATRQVRSQMSQGPQTHHFAFGEPSTALRFARHDRPWPYIASPDWRRPCHHIPAAPDPPQGRKAGGPVSGVPARAWKGVSDVRQKGPGVESSHFRGKRLIPITNEFFVVWHEQRVAASRSKTLGMAPVSRKTIAKLRLGPPTQSIALGTP